MVITGGVVSLEGGRDGVEGEEELADAMGVPRLVFKSPRSRMSFPGSVLILPRLTSLPSFS